MSSRGVKAAPAPDAASSAALKELEAADFAERLWRKDASLWKAEPEHQKIISDSLGWLSLPDAMAAGLGPIRSFADEIRRGGFDQAVVLGMGGSSLSCEVFRALFSEPRGQGFPRLSILDTTHPGAVLRAADSFDFKRTLFIVSSKSGSTVEPNALLAYLHKRSSDAGGKAEQRFVAITDPGTSLEKLARSRGFRKVFINQRDIGGRYSALSYFGLVPAAVMGADLEALLGGARRLLKDARAKGVSHEAFRLGAALGGHAREGKNKLALCLEPARGALGLWIEQLVAESTGKEGKGILPFLNEDEEPAGRESRGSDRIFVAIGAAQAPQPPVARLALKAPEEIGAHFLLWELATAAAGFLLGVDPFDQPDVERSKTGMRELLSRPEKGELPAEKAHLRAGNLAGFCDAGLLAALGKTRDGQFTMKEALAAHFGRGRASGYAALLAYLDPDGECRPVLEAVASRLRRTTPAPVTLSFGPRYLHSTGQLYKGGDNNGIFLMITESDPADVPIPGQRYGFGTLHRAQARGDFAAMLEAGRRVLRIDLGRGGAEALRSLLNAMPS